MFMRGKEGKLMIEIAVCDDNKNDLHNVTEILHDIFSQKNIDCNIESFLSANELLCNTKKIDIGILDIVMDERNGIDLGRKLKAKFPEICLIYTTSYKQYVMQAINSVHAYSYLCKPIDNSKIRMQIDELVSRLSNKILEKDFHNVIDSQHKNYASVTLKLKEIVYFEYIKRQRKVAIILKNEIYEYNCSFEHIVDEFQKYDFAVNCRGTLVNLRHVVKIKGYTVYLDNETQLPISQRRVADFRKNLNDFLQRNS